ncbi:MAG: apolipoprotein N-acyltransferase [Burkholderiales bacterium]|nr:apolipoprotein N-acyltransferase [Burkholderiales bacterium]
MAAGLALLLGALQTLAFVRTAAWGLPLATTAALAWLLARGGAARAAWLGWAYGTGWLTAGVWWLYVSMHRYGDIAAPLAAAAVLALAAFLALYLAAACAAFAHWRSGRWGRDALLFAALWLLAELARGTLLTGFPWLAAGYSQVDAPLAALAPWLGVYGMGAVLAWCAAALAGLAASRGRAWHGTVAAALLLAGLAVVGPGEHTRAHGALALTLVQTDVPQEEKFSSERMGATLAAVARDLLDAPSGLVIVPETAVPLLPDQLEDFAPGYWAALRRRFAQSGRAALIGVPLGDFERGYTNSVIGLAAGAPEYRYDKHHLVPFGEFIPRGFRWFTDAMQIPLGDFTRGVVAAPSFAFDGQRIAPTICYEDLFGEEIALRFADAARAPTIIANLSNIGWFGDTVAVPQHLAISRLRALEFQRPVVRATNTGATAIIDHRGRVRAELEPFTRGSLSGIVEGRDGLTPYAAWVSRTGLWPLAAAALALVLLLAARARVGARRVAP